MRKQIFTVVMMLLATTLLVSQSQAECQPGDTVAPDRIIDFTARPIGLNKVELAWSVPKDQSDIASYDIRYRVNTPLNGLNWTSSSQIAGEPIPRKIARDDAPTPRTITGWAENMVIDMPAGSAVYFGIKATDECGKVNALSNTQQVNSPYAVPTSNVITMSNVSLNTSGTATSTVYLNTNGMMGYSFLIVYDPAKVSISDIQASTKSNSFRGYTDSNLQISSSGFGEHRNKLLAAYEAAGKKAVIAVGVSLDVQVGMIPLFDITFTGVSPGAASLLIIPEKVSVISATASLNPADVYPYPAPLNTQITVQ